jgi:hypothetical protein
MENSVFCDVTPCTALEIKQYSGGPVCLHLQGGRIKHSPAYCLLDAGFLHGLLFSSVSAD